MSYKQAHNRVTRVRGIAKDCFCSAPRCYRQAMEWALDKAKAERAGRLRFEGNRFYSDDPNDYEPLCYQCHRYGDGNFRGGRQ